MPYKDPEKERARCRVKEAKRRAVRTPEQHEIDKEKNRIRMANLAASRTSERKNEIQDYNREYLKRPDVRQRRQAAENKKRQLCPEVRALANLRNRIWEVIGRDGQSGTAERLLGCTTDQFLGHLEINFEPGMTWENYGRVWHVDHRRPCASFDLTDPAQQRECFGWKNLQPLFAKDNLRKGTKLLI